MNRRPPLLDHLTTLLCVISLGSGFMNASASEGSLALVQKGIGMLEAQEFENAVRVFEYAVRIDPTDGEANFFFGVAENRLRDGKEALSRIRRARLLGYGHPRMIIEESYALLHLGNYGQVLQALSTPFEKEPQNAEINYLLGRAYYGLGQFE
ncbi:MAG: hypothetical protein AAF387_21855, partial [Pseudomonadota bacterium]